MTIKSTLAVIAACILTFSIVGTASGLIANPLQTNDLPDEVQIVGPSEVEWSPELAQNGFNNSVEHLLPNASDKRLRTLLTESCLFFDSGYDAETIKGYWHRAGGYNPRQSEGIAMAASEFCQYMNTDNLQELSA